METFPMELQTKSEILVEIQSKFAILSGEIEVEKFVVLREILTLLIL
jgi:hypothetical protein